MTIKTVPLGEIVTFIRGVTFDKSQQDSKASDANLPLLRAGNIGRQLDLTNDLIYLPRSIVSSEQMLRNGDIVICLSSGSPKVVGKTATFKGESDYSVGAFCGIIRPRDVLDSDYLTLWFRSTKFTDWRDEQARGANIQNLRFSELAKLIITLPNKLEQRRIVTILSARLSGVEEARQAAAGQSKDLDKLTFAILKDTFEDVVNAERVRIADVAPTTSGTTPSRSHKEYWTPPKYPWVKTGEIVFNPILSTEEMVSEKALRDCSLRLLPPGTVLIAMYGQGKTRGQSAILEVEATINQACFAILPNDSFESEYLQFWFRFSYEALRTLSEARGGNQSNLNGAILNDSLVPLITRDRQRVLAKRIKEALSEVNMLRLSLHSQIRDIDILPSRLLAQAFQG